MYLQYDELCNMPICGYAMNVLSQIVLGQSSINRPNTDKQMLMIIMYHVKCLISGNRAMNGLSVANCLDDHQSTSCIA